MEQKILAQRIARICDDREHGSRWLVREAILLMRDLARTLPLSTHEGELTPLYRTGYTLAHARPAMAALTNAMAQLLSTPGDSLAIVQAAERWLQDDETAIARIASHAQALLQGQLMTCSISGTTLAVLLACRQQLSSVVTLEGRPRYEGRTLAEALARQGVAVTLITDAQADIFLPDCAAVIVGADSVLANGDVLNKAGTALLAWAARGHGIPFYVTCETLKISPQRWRGDFSLLEEKESAEVLEKPLAGVTVRNFYFDRTPHELVTGVITERGIVDAQAISTIASMFALYRKTLEERARA